MAYFARTDVETFLNLTLTAEGQALVDALIPALEAFANRYCNRSWNLATPQVETFDGDGVRTAFFVANPPIATVTSVVVDDTTLSAADEDYYVYDTYVRLATAAAADYQNVVITYTTSSSNLPADLKHALIRWCAEIFKSAEDGGKTTKRARFGQAEVEYLTRDGMPQFVKDVLDSYRLRPV